MGLSRNARVGAFVLAGLLVCSGIIFMIGDSRRMFESHTPYKVVFSDVQGLQTGSPVRMGGVDIGHVTSVGYPEKAETKQIDVVISIASREGRRIRADSVVTISMKGLLGDKMLEVSVGSSEKPAVAPGGLIPSENPADLAGMLARVGSIGKKAERTLAHLEKTSETLSEDEFRGDVKRSARALASVLEALDEGEGYIPRLLHDKHEAERLSRTFESLERSSAHLEHTLATISQVAGRVRSGPGTAHEIIYGDSSTKAVAQVGSAAAEVATTLRKIREGDGLAHGLLFGGEHAPAAAQDLSAASADLRAVMADLRAGKGTLGALLVDPSVYEDVKLLLGNAQRNHVLRSLVRYSIQQDEAASVEAKDP